MGGVQEGSGDGVEDTPGFGESWELGGVQGVRREVSGEGCWRGPRRGVGGFRGSVGEVQGVYSLPNLLFSGGHKEEVASDHSSTDLKKKEEI